MLKNLDLEKPGIFKIWTRNNLTLKTWDKYGTKKRVRPYRIIFYKCHAQFDFFFKSLFPNGCLNFSDYEMFL